jgi:hypothetical protein
LAARGRRAAAHDVRKVQGKNNAKCREVQSIMSEQSIDASSTGASFRIPIPILTKMKHILPHEDGARQGAAVRSGRKVFSGAAVAKVQGKEVWSF